MRRLPMLPKEVSARAAKAATLAGSTYTGCRRDGMSQGRLPTASAARVRAARRGSLVNRELLVNRGFLGDERFLVNLGLLVKQGFLVNRAAGTATRAVMARAAKPPITAGRRARDRRAAPRRETRSGASMARRTQGRAA